MHCNKLILVIAIFNYLTEPVSSGCTRTNDQKNYTCSGFKFYQLRASPNRKQNIIRTRIYDCKEKEVPEDVLPFPNLEYLTISCSMLELIHKNAFRNTNILKELNLESNAISSLPADLFQPLPELQMLNLCKNNIEKLPQNTFKGLAKLKSLMLSQNKLSDLNENAFSHIEKIEELLLDHNKISFIPRIIFNPLKQVMIINLSYNKIENLEDLFTSTSKLTHLNVSNNEIDNLPTHPFFTTQLEILDLSFNKLTVIYEDSLPLLTLKELYLQKNKISVFEVKGSVADFPLYLLDLRSNRLVLLEDDFITGAKNLEILKVENNPWDCKCFEKMAMLRGNFSLELSAEYRNGEEPLCVVENRKDCSVNKNNTMHYYKILEQYWDLR